MGKKKYEQAISRQLSKVSKPGQFFCPFYFDMMALLEVELRPLLRFEWRYLIKTAGYA